jgi:hypothetical protein
MMSKIIDARTVSIENSRILFDANVWMFINRFGAYSMPDRANSYSAAYKALLQKNNKIVLNNYVLGEFFNRCAKLEYELRKTEFEAENVPIPRFKLYRRSSEFESVLESIRDTCLNMLDDCEYVSVDGHHYDIKSVLNECCDQCADFTDRVLIDFCTKEKLFIMTDDADFVNCGLDVITANKKMHSGRR